MKVSLLACNNMFVSCTCMYVYPQVIHTQILMLRGSEKPRDCLNFQFHFHSRDVAAVVSHTLYMTIGNPFNNGHLEWPISTFCI